MNCTGESTRRRRETFSTYDGLGGKESEGVAFGDYGLQRWRRQGPSAARRRPGASQIFTQPPKTPRDPSESVGMARRGKNCLSSGPLKPRLKKRNAPLAPWVSWAETGTSWAGKPWPLRRAPRISRVAAGPAAPHGLCTSKGGLARGMFCRVQWFCPARAGRETAGSRRKLGPRNPTRCPLRSMPRFARPVGAFQAHDSGLR